MGALIMQTFHEYPLVMRHPGHRSPHITKRQGRDPVSGKAFTDYDATPGTLPDVTVKNADQEAYYGSRGYVRAGKSDPAAHLRVAARTSLDYKPQPDAPPRPKGPLMYPKALTPPGGGEQVIVRDAAEEAAVLERWTAPAEAMA